MKKWFIFVFFLAGCSSTQHNLNERLDILEGRQQSFDAIIIQNRKTTVDTLNKLIERTDYLKQHQDNIKKQLRFEIADVENERN